MRNASKLFLVVALFAFSAFQAAPASEGYVVLYNESSLIVALVYASPCDADEWGDDLLPVDILYPGEHALITVTPGCWDFMAITEDGQELDHYGIRVRADDEIDWTITD
jgi:hypothetical protein